jgi:hypothetical protein
MLKLETLFLLAQIYINFIRFRYEMNFLLFDLMFARCLDGLPSLIILQAFQLNFNLIVSISEFQRIFRAAGFSQMSDLLIESRLIYFPLSRKVFYRNFDEFSTQILDGSKSFRRMKSN